MVPVQARPTLWARVPADRQAFLNHCATARTDLARKRRIDRYDSPTGACCPVGEDSQERRPPRILDALGEVVVSHHVADLQIFMIDSVIRAHERQRGFVVKIGSLATYP